MFVRMGLIEAIYIYINIIYVPYLLQVMVINKYGDKRCRGMVLNVVC